MPAPPPPPPAPQAKTNYPYIKVKFETLLNLKAIPPFLAYIIAVSFQKLGQLEIDTENKKPYTAKINRKKRPVIGKNNYKKQTSNHIYKIINKKLIRKRYSL